MPSGSRTHNQYSNTWQITLKYILSQCSTAVLPLLQNRKANHTEIAKFRRFRTPKPLKWLTKNLAWVIMSAMSPSIPKLKTNAPLGTWWRRMREISPSDGFQFSYPIVSVFLRPQILLASLDYRRTDFYAVCFIWRQFPVIAFLEG